MKRTKDKPISPQQLKALQACFGKMGMDADERHGFIHQFTDGRVSSTKELTFDEARLMLSRLNENRDKQNPEEILKLVKAIYHLSMRISFLNRDFPSDNVADFKMNKAKINIFCRNRTKYRKNLTRMSITELKEVKKQLEAIAYKEEQELKSKRNNENK